MAAAQQTTCYIEVCVDAQGVRCQSKLCYVFLFQKGLEIPRLIKTTYQFLFNIGSLGSMHPQITLYLLKIDRQKTLRATMFVHSFIFFFLKTTHIVCLVPKDTEA